MHSIPDYLIFLDRLRSTLVCPFPAAWTRSYFRADQRLIKLIDWLSTAHAQWLLIDDTLLMNFELYPVHNELWPVNSNCIRSNKTDVSVLVYDRFRISVWFISELRSIMLNVFFRLSAHLFFIVLELWIETVSWMLNWSFKEVRGKS